MWDFIHQITVGPIIELFSLANPFSVYSLLGAALTAFLWYVVTRRRSFARRARAFARISFSRRFWGHRSTLLDLKLFFVSNCVNAAGIVSVFAISYAASAATQALLAHVVAPAPAAMQASLPIALAMAVVYWVMFDLGYWVAHWLMHRIPVLWEFHKIHHSAEELSPLPEWRQHPVEL